MPELHLKQPVFACFAQDAAYFDTKELAGRTISDKILRDRAYEIARNNGYDIYQRALEIIVYKLFDTKTGSGISVNEQLVEILHAQMIKKFKRRLDYARFKRNIWPADLAEMEWLPSKNRNAKYFLCVIDIFTKYAWVKPLKNKKDKAVLNVLIEIVNKSNRKPNKLWVDQGR